MNDPQAGDSVLSVLPLLDTHSLGQIIVLNHAWNVLAKDDAYWESRVVQKWPSARLLITMPGHRGKCYALYLRRKCLDFSSFGLEEPFGKILWQPHAQTALTGYYPGQPGTCRILIELYIACRGTLGIALQRSRMPVYHSLLELQIGDRRPDQMPARLNLFASLQSHGLRLVVNSLLLTAIIVRGDDYKMLKICDQLPVDIDITTELHSNSIDEIWFEEVIIHMVPACLQPLFRQYRDASPGISLRPILDGVQHHDHDGGVLTGFAHIGFQIRIHHNNTRQMVRGGGGVPGGGSALLQFWGDHCRWI